MQIVRIIVLVIALPGTLLLSADARSHHHRHNRRSAAEAPPHEELMTDPDKWCTGGFPITDEQQIRGCTALITRRDREKRATAYYNRANAYFSKGDLAAAIRDYSEAINIKPQYLEALNNRAVAYRVTKNFGEAITDYSEVLRITPHDIAALTGRGSAYGMKNDNAPAIADLTEAIAIGARDVSARLQRGHAYLRSQKWPEAQADYDQVLAAAPSNPEAYFGRACAKVYSGDPKSGTADLAQAYLLDQNILATMVAQGISSPILFKPEDASVMQNSRAPARDPASTSAPVSGADTSVPDKP